MFKRNPGRFCHRITLLKPSAPVRDELGGLSETTYAPAVTLSAMCEQRNQSRQQIVGDYVTVDTRYFVVRDIRGMSAVKGLDTSWRLSYRDFIYLINDILLLDESRPYFLQITATAINSEGGPI